MSQNDSNLVEYNRNSEEKKPTSVIAYLRTSKPKEKDKASFEEQRRVIDAVEAKGDVVILEVYEDAHSARNEHERCERPGFNKAEKRALELGVPILVARADRFTRSPATFKRYSEKGGVLLVATLGLEASVERIDLAIQLAAEDVEHTRRVCAIGMENSGKRAGNPNLEDARRRSCEVRHEKAIRGYEELDRRLQVAVAAGAKTLRDKAVALNRSGFKTARGKRWTPANVKLKEDIIAGLKVAGRFGIAAPASVGNDNAGAITSSSNPHAGIPNFDIQRAVIRDEIKTSEVTLASNNNTVALAPAFPLSPEQVAEFVELLETHSADLEKNRKLIAQASHPRLSEKDHMAVLAWIAKKRAAAA